MEKYSTYTCADFASDRAFIRWVRTPDAASDAFWAQLIGAYPKLKAETDHARLIVQAMRFDERELSEAEIRTLWNRVETDVRSKNRFVRRYWWAAAACAASVVALFGLWRWTAGVDTREAEEPDQLSEFATQTTQAVAGNEVQLILADKSSYTVETDHAELQYDSTGQVRVNAKDVINRKTENINSHPQMKKVEFNQVVVPWGKRTTVRFADGTRMWLNSGSRAIYAVEFSGKQREVFIEGEAYFEVAEDKTKPFVVKTGSAEISVLGTVFNVNTYQHEKDITIALVSGAVAVTGKNRETTHLQPGQIVKIDHLSSERMVQNVNMYDYICWKDGLLQFKSETLELILSRVERHYAIPVSIETSLGEYRITGKLDLKETIGETLKVIEKLAPVRYEINNNQVFIHQK